MFFLTLLRLVKVIGQQIGNVVETELLGACKLGKSKLFPVGLIQNKLCLTLRTLSRRLWLEKGFARNLSFRDF